MGAYGLDWSGSGEDQMKDLYGSDGKSTGFHKMLWVSGVGSSSRSTVVRGELVHCV